MEELIARIVTSVGIPESLAKTAVGLILNMFQKEGDAGAVASLLNALPGSGDLASAAASATSDGDSGGGLGGLMGSAASMLGGGGGVMALVGQLTGAGLSIDQAKGVGSELMNFATEKAGADVVAQVAKSIPGLDRLL
ncbi:MAG: DUF2267 domain-containing protein [Hyphomicrobiaceae bacterium]|nr:DUF2267 domain-containing protein [Hyphomicrobiaceae bacterium]